MLTLSISNRGDTVPEMYRTDEYNIKQWQLRNLPAPDAGTHWTYMGGAYVLINDTDGKIIKAYDGDFFIIAKSPLIMRGKCRHLIIFIISHLLVLLVISRISR